MGNSHGRMTSTGRRTEHGVRMSALVTRNVLHTGISTGMLQTQPACAYFTGTHSSETRWLAGGGGPTLKATEQITSARCLDLHSMPATKRNQVRTGVPFLASWPSCVHCGKPRSKHRYLTNIDRRGPYCVLCTLFALQATSSYNCRI